MSEAPLVLAMLGISFWLYAIGVTVGTGTATR